MSARSTKTDLDAEFERSGTDWPRLRALTDKQIVEAVEADADSYLLENADVLGHREAAYRYVLYMDSAWRWRWRLTSADGRIIAESGESMRTKREASQSIAAARRALLGGTIAA